MTRKHILAACLLFVALTLAIAGIAGVAAETGLA